MNRDILPASTILSLSQREVAGTARSMGMGGAFASLGADMASLSYNPAGVGMYQRNEVSMSFGIGVSKAHNNGYNAYNPAENSNTRAAANSLGASFKVHESSGKLTAINFAFAYNKIADYNYDISYNSLPTESSLADAFADIANANGLGINSSNKITDQNGYYDYDMNPYFWGTAMAYKAGLINMGSNGGWYPDEIGPGAQMTQYTTLRSRGSAGEFSFALGMNISNILYLGASLDLVSISRKQTIHYSEYISYAGARPDAAAYPYQLQEFRFGQSMQIDGSGVGDIGSVVLRDRKHLGEDGLMVVSVILSNKGKILAGPDILSRGFVYVKDSEQLIEATKAVVEKAVLSGISENKRDWQNLKTRIRDSAGSYLYTATQRSPMILPIITEISEDDFDIDEDDII